MSQNNIYVWSYIEPNSLWGDCESENLKMERSVFHLDGRDLGQVSLASIFVDHNDGHIFAIEYYKRKNKHGGLAYDGLREYFETIELALFTVSLRAKERLNIDIDYSKAQREFYEYKKNKGNS